MIARILAWLFRTFPGRGSVLASLPAPDLGPYRSGSITEGSSRLIVRTPPFDAAAARALAEMPPVCPKDVMDAAIGEIRRASLAGKTKVDLGYRWEDQSVALSRELKALGFKVSLDVLNKLIVSW